MPKITFQLTGETISTALIKYRPDMIHRFSPSCLDLTIDYEISNQPGINIISFSLIENRQNLNKDESSLLKYCAEFLIKDVIVKLYGLQFDSKKILGTKTELFNIKFMDLLSDHKENLIETQFKFLKCLEYEGFLLKPHGEQKSEEIDLLKILKQKPIMLKEIFLLRAIYRLEAKLQKYNVYNEASENTISNLGEIIQHHVIANYPEKSAEELLILYIKHLKFAIKQEKKAYLKESSQGFFSRFFTSRIGKEYEETLEYLSSKYPKTNFNNYPSLSELDNIKDPWNDVAIMCKP